MAPSTKLGTATVALGFRVKSGWAAAVLVRLVDGLPTVLCSRRVELADPDTPRSYQPYHAAAGTAETDETKIARMTALIERTAERTIAHFVHECRNLAPKPQGAAVVRTSATDPSRIGNPHVRIHALEGQLFPRIAATALGASGIAVTPMLEGDLWAGAAQTLGLGPAALRNRLVELGRGVAGGWRAEQKTAALAAWMLLVDRAGFALAEPA
jgi:hypothetical protein